MKINYRTDKDKKSAVCEKQKVGGNLVPVPMIFILKIKQPPTQKKVAHKSQSNNWNIVAVSTLYLKSRNWLKWSSFRVHRISLR